MSNTNEPTLLTYEEIATTLFLLKEFQDSTLHVQLFIQINIDQEPIYYVYTDGEETYVSHYLNRTIEFFNYQTGTWDSYTSAGAIHYYDESN